jgi:hypothetical protein
VDELDLDIFLGMGEWAITPVIALLKREWVMSAEFGFILIELHTIE